MKNAQLFMLMLTNYLGLGHGLGLQLGLWHPAIDPEGNTLHVGAVHKSPCLAEAKSGMCCSESHSHFTTFALRSSKKGLLKRTASAAICYGSCAYRESRRRIRIGAGKSIMKRSGWGWACVIDQTKCRHFLPQLSAVDAGEAHKTEHANRRVHQVARLIHHDHAFTGGLEPELKIEVHIQGDNPKQCKAPIKLYLGDQHVVDAYCTSRQYPKYTLSC